MIEPRFAGDLRSPMLVALSRQDLADLEYLRVEPECRFWENLSSRALAYSVRQPSAGRSVEERGFYIAL